MVFGRSLMSGSRLVLFLRFFMKVVVAAEFLADDVEAGFVPNRIFRALLIRSLSNGYTFVSFGMFVSYGLHCF